MPNIFFHVHKWSYFMDHDSRRMVRQCTCGVVEKV